LRRIAYKYWSAAILVGTGFKRQPAIVRTPLAIDAAKDDDAADLTLRGTCTPCAIASLAAEEERIFSSVY
jgi:hypothetical protein